MLYLIEWFGHKKTRLCRRKLVSKPALAGGCPQCAFDVPSRGHASCNVSYETPGKQSLVQNKYS
jgi:hypothetical protein